MPHTLLNMRTRSHDWGKQLSQANIRNKDSLAWLGLLIANHEKG